ncbi:hypothetical protein OZX62_01540 [Bifidobacterium sp. ESL0690]|uniref:hypothetical protein n=1 Tax=Bifidobacterium sp. ESL0690 TaxID=2983214 RepID=UPI0023F633AB|nr:hypothetical protein [Bifidobacterium sp. ESL0690]WEV47008.1 hypothetical protein OZX62_01540 [Bifidobacterium sp. ESL0690]
MTDFDPNAMPSTPRHHIKYPGNNDLVKYAALQFAAMAMSIDDNIDRLPAEVTDLVNRQSKAATEAAAQAADAYSKIVSTSGFMPVVRTTLAELNKVTGVDGRTGIVTRPEDESFIYHWVNGAWWPSPITGLGTKNGAFQKWIASMLEDMMPASKWLTPTPYAFAAPWLNTLHATKIGCIAIASGQANVKATFAGLTNASGSEKLPEGLVPATAGTILFSGNNSQTFSLRLSMDGTMSMSGSGNTNYFFNYTGAWVCRS